MPIGVIAFVVYILAILVWMLVIKRNIAEAMLVGLIVIALFNGPANILKTLWDATFAASKESSFLATMLFLLMAVVMTKTGIIAKLVELLNSMIGRVRGGAAYVSVCASFLFGLVSGNAIANCSTVGAITVPWMKDSGWPETPVSVRLCRPALPSICWSVWRRFPPWFLLARLILPACAPVPGPSAIVCSGSGCMRENTTCVRCPRIKSNPLDNLSMTTGLLF